ncbi:MAG TPA: hypothetical protein VNZ52_11060 [Candidatus Thermoplasmatota archaeon]|nr:hypothetical protein [Candidatus Thermoplasmatota archaeon]
MASTTTTIWPGLLIAGLVLLAAAGPAAAMGFGANTESLDFAKSKGWTPSYTMYWVGPWSKSSWNAVEGALIKARDAGVTPVLQWYYWGDSISVNCVKYGCDGRSQGDWNAMGATLAQKVNSIMGGRQAIIIVETEFNKGGIDNWEEFDGILANHIYMMKSKAPNARFSLGFGAWGQDKYGMFDRAVGAVHMTSFQLMRASTRDTDAQISNAPDVIKSMTVTLKGKFGKPVLLHDLAISSYGGKEWLQDQVMKNILSRKGEYEAAGLTGIVYRDVRDNPSMPLNNYYGYGERHFGFWRADGSAKPVWWTWKAGATGGYVAPATSTPPSSTTSVASSGVPSFTGIQAKNWWQQVSVSGSPIRVDVRINDGAWIQMEKKSWGAYATSKPLNAGDKVQFQAGMPDGKWHWSPAYKANGDGSVAAWSGSTSSAPAPSTSGSVTFTPVKLNNYWQQVKVGGSVATVEVNVGGTGWAHMKLESWGDWTKSAYGPAGTSVQFRATPHGGATVYSGMYKTA